MSEVKLEWFVGRGEFELCGVDLDCRKVEGKDRMSYGEEQNLVRFRLNVDTFEAAEDPSDGYRSSLDTIRRVDQPVKNTFPATLVRAEWDTREDEDVIHFVNISNNKIVLSIGTSNTDDYYPAFVGNFQPQNLTGDADQIYQGRAIIAENLEHERQNDARRRRELLANDPNFGTW